MKITRTVVNGISAKNFSKDIKSPSGGIHHGWVLLIYQQLNVMDEKDPQVLRTGQVP